MTDIKITKRLFPIRDRDFHVQGLELSSTSIRQALETQDQIDAEEEVAAAWHTTAIAYLDFGRAHNLGGPGAEEVDANNRVSGVRPIKKFLRLAYDDNGYAFMMHEFE